LFNKLVPFCKINKLKKSASKTRPAELNTWGAKNIRGANGNLGTSGAAFASGIAGGS
jgi:hypothetical protein